MKPAVIILYITTILTLIAATIVESIKGTGFINEYVYDSIWFFILFLSLTVIGIIMLIKKYRQLSFPGLLFHLSFVVILIGAACTWCLGVRGKVNLKEGKPTMYFYDSEYNEYKLPFQIKLDAFVIDYYPGTNAASNYISKLTLTENDISEKATISMNNIIKKSGYRLYQSSYNIENKTSLLNVNYDPLGNTITHIGYTLLFLSMILLLIWKRGKFKKLLKHPAIIKSSLALVLFAGISDFSIAQSAIEPQTNIISQGFADSLSSKQIIYRDRVVPFNTMSKDVVMKLYGDSKYKNLSPDRVIGSFLIYPDSWQNEKIIEIKSATLRKMLELSSKYASVSDLYDENGNYRLDKYKNRAVDHESQNSLIKSLNQTDEKIGIIKMLVNGNLFSSIPDDGSVEKLNSLELKAELIYNKVPLVKIMFMFNLAVGFIFAALLYFSLFGKITLSKQTYRLISIITYTAWIILTLYMCLIWYISGHVPLSNGYNTMIFLSWHTLMLACLTQWKFKYIAPIGLLLSGFTLLVAYITVKNPQITQLVPVLNSPWLTSHVSFIMISYSLFFFMLVNSILILILNSNNNILYKDKIDTLCVLNKIFLYPAEVLLGAGIFIGAIWANLSWGRYWAWDPKEVWALISFLIFGILFHEEFLPKKNRTVWYQIIVIIGALAIIMTYFGVNHLLGGLHSYK